MSLHHFYWEGKERAVSIIRISSNITLLFIDTEIIDKGVNKLSFRQGESLKSILNKYQLNEEDSIKNILLAIQENTGYQLFASEKS